MRTLDHLFLTLILFIAFFTFIGVGHCKDKQYDNLTATVISIYDGDTMTVSIKDVPAVFGEKMSIRLRGIDTPEMKGQCDAEKALAGEAKKFVMNKIPIGSTIILTNVGRDKYFRLDATILLADGTSLSQLLIDNHLAYEYDGGTKQS